jgi:hypothetical protein
LLDFGGEADQRATGPPTGSDRPKSEVRRIDVASPKLSFKNVVAPTLHLTYNFVR